jgi:hypothetical protein
LEKFFFLIKYLQPYLRSAILQSKNKINDSELFIKKKWKIGQHIPEAQRKIFFTYEFGPTTKKIYFSLLFFKKFCLFD